MTWTTETRLDALMRLPWTIDVERNAREGYVILRARELPGSIATGSETEVVTEFWDSLRATLACYLEFDDPIPLPASVKQLPWDVPALAERTLVLVRPSLELFTETRGAGAFALVG